jgi:hypothetical protein
MVPAVCGERIHTANLHPAMIEVETAPNVCTMLYLLPAGCMGVKSTAGRVETLFLSSLNRRLLPAERHGGGG